MAGYRQIHTQIWKDEWFIDLEPQEKLLFIYLFSNDLASISGLYRIPIKVITNETGLDREYVIRSLQKFEASKRVYYADGTMWIVNMAKYHQSASGTVMTKVQKDVEMVPDGAVKTAYQQYIDSGLFPIDTLSIPCAYPSVKDKDKDKDKGAARQPRPTKTPAPFMDCQAVTAYRDKFHKPPNEEQRQEIAGKITDLALWETILSGWRLHDWKPGNIPGMIEAYQAGGRACGHGNDQDRARSGGDS